MKRVAFILAAFAALAVVVASADAAGIGPSQAPNIKVKNGESTNWSGYAVPANSGEVTDVVGSWKVPTISQCGSTTATTGTNVRAGVASNSKSGHGKPGSGGGTTTGYSSTWVGIDGDNSNTVEQIGTEQDCISGAPRYYAWYEMYPQYPTNLSTDSYPVQPGDTITAEVKYTSGSSFDLTLSSSRGWNYGTTQSSSSAKRSSAEWIVEAPWSGRVLPLADFGTVDFSGAGATIGTTKGTISNWPYDAITMVTNNGTVKASPSGLSSNGSAFDVTWAHQ